MPCIAPGAGLQSPVFYIKSPCWSMKLEMPKVLLSAAVHRTLTGVCDKAATPGCQSLSVHGQTLTEGRGYYRSRRGGRVVMALACATLPLLLLLLPLLCHARQR